jgi:hypothetical protein
MAAKQISDVDATIMTHNVGCGMLCDNSTFKKHATFCTCFIKYKQYGSHVKFILSLLLEGNA